MRIALTHWIRLPPLANALPLLLGAAFAQYFSADAMHLGPPTEAGLVVGVDNVARGVAGQDPLNTPATIPWRPDTSIVASSGFPFFTIWRRPGVDAPWR